jgi:uncharacterized protein YbaR (Trm112 family)
MICPVCKKRVKKVNRKKKDGIAYHKKCGRTKKG